MQRHALRGLLVLSLALAGAPPGYAQVHRCTGADGNEVFTDRQCTDIGGVEQLSRAPAVAGARAARGGCARNLQDLMFEMTSAIDARDANRLAGVYHWTGMSGSGAYAVLTRLDALVQRPLVDIVPVLPDVAAAAAGDAGVDAPAIDGDYYPQASVRQSPVALRVEQTLANGSTPSRTVFGLQKHFGCWWIKG
ncbi:hypothetical protein ACFOLC_07735 [Lysobacter cavernae]|uniref:DUF4124 domain-containing protein n=1 Tax=Lysobacter cavernae TaxID=1685901 RepID=A0ABV7RP36_9GAMM